MAQVTIETIKNGPYIVTGEVELIDVDGNKFPVEKRMALCRCGASTEKPFCDGTHSKRGFKAVEKAVPESKDGRRAFQSSVVLCHSRTMRPRTQCRQMVRHSSFPLTPNDSRTREC